MYSVYAIKVKITVRTGIYIYKEVSQLAGREYLGRCKKRASGPRL